MTIYDAIKKVVEKLPVSTYLYGSPAEVQQQLVNMSREIGKKDIKYPAVILFTPIEELKEQDAIKTVSEVSLNLVIVTNTERSYSTSYRVFKTYGETLYPIYEAFMEELRLSPYFNIDSNGRIPHKKTDLFYYSPTPANEQNVFSAVLDAIEIQNLELKLKLETPDECLI